MPDRAQKLEQAIEKFLKDSSFIRYKGLIDSIQIHLEPGEARISEVHCGLIPFYELESALTESKQQDPDPVIIP